MKKPVRWTPASPRLSAGLADGDRTVAGFQDNFRAAAASVFPFQMGVTGLRRRLLKGIRVKLGVNIAGMAIGENLKA
jgi:hypothetical protein